MGAFDRHFDLCLGVVLGGGAVLAWVNRFIQDDTFISLRYAANLTSGHGLVFNPGGERVEGYTNFLWTIMLAGVMRVGIDPLLFMDVLGALTMPVTLWLTHRLARHVTGSPVIGLIAAALVAGNYTFTAYATGGLETHLQTLLGVLVAERAADGTRRMTWRWTRCLTISLACAAALLTRLDSVVLVAIPGLVALIHAARSTGSPGERARRGALLLAPGGAVVLAWLAWKVDYYGEVLPNTFSAKTGSLMLPLRGVFYVLAFSLSYALLPIGLGFLVIARRALVAWGASALAIAAGVPVLWLAYVALVGGDFMEFRFIVPAIPLVMVLTAWTIDSLSEQLAWRATMVALTFVASAFHAIAFTYSPLRRGMETIPDLIANLEPEHGAWVRIGRVLGEALPTEERVVIAVTPAGAIPYYSGLDTIDMLGLNDRWVARHGAFLSHRPGHNRIATIRYLRERNVNLLIGHPLVVDEAPRRLHEFAYADLRHMFVMQDPPDPESIPADAAVIAVPLDPRRALICMYLQPNPGVERAIAQRGWIIRRGLSPARTP